MMYGGFVFLFFFWKIISYTDLMIVCACVIGEWWYLRLLFFLYKGRKIKIQKIAWWFFLFVCFCSYFFFSVFPFILYTSFILYDFSLYIHLSFWFFVISLWWAAFSLLLLLLLSLFNLNTFFFFVFLLFLLIFDYIFCLFIFYCIIIIIVNQTVNKITSFKKEHSFPV